MKKRKILMILLGIFILQLPAYAEFSYEDFAEAAMKNHSMLQEFDVSKLKADENGDYIFCDMDKDGYPEVSVNIADSFRKSYYFQINSPEEVVNYNGENFVNYFEDNKGKKGYSYIYDTVDGLKDISYDIDSETYGYKEWFEVCTLQNAGFDKSRYENVLKILGESGASSISDAYEFQITAYVPYAKRSDGTIKTKRCYAKAFFFDTNKGIYITTYKSDTDGTVKPEENILYGAEEFLKKMTAIYDEIEPVETAYEYEIVVDTNGEEATKTETISPIDDTKDEKKETDDTEDIYNEQTYTEDKTKETGEDVKDAVKEDEKDSEPEKEPLKNWVDVKIDGKEIAFEDQQPLIENDRVLVPMRKIFEELGAEIEWDEETQTVTATIGDTVITLQIGKNEITKNGVTTEIDTEAQLVNDRTLVPLRAVSESFGNTVTWNAETKTVEITK